MPPVGRPGEGGGPASPAPTPCPSAPPPPPPAPAAPPCWAPPLLLAAVLLFLLIKPLSAPIVMVMPSLLRYATGSTSHASPAPLPRSSACAPSSSTRASPAPPPACRSLKAASILLAASSRKGRQSPFFASTYHVPRSRRCSSCTPYAERRARAGTQASHMPLRTLAHVRASKASAPPVKWPSRVSANALAAACAGARSALTPAPTSARSQAAESPGQRGTTSAAAAG